MFENIDWPEDEKIHVGPMLLGLLVVAGFALALDVPLWISSLISGAVGVAINESINHVARKKKKTQMVSDQGQKKERHLKLVQK